MEDQLVKLSLFASSNEGINSRNDLNFIFVDSKDPSGFESYVLPENKPFHRIFYAFRKPAKISRKCLSINLFNQFLDYISDTEIVPLSSRDHQARMVDWPIYGFASNHKDLFFVRGLYNYYSTSADPIHLGFYFDPLHPSYSSALSCVDNFVNAISVKSDDFKITAVNPLEGVVNVLGKKYLKACRMLDKGGLLIDDPKDSKEEKMDKKGFRTCLLMNSGDD